MKNVDRRIQIMNIEGYKEYKEYWVRITDMTALLRCASFGLASIRVPVVKVRDSGNDDRLIVVGSVFREADFSCELFLLRRHTKVLSLEEALEFNIRDEARKTNLCIDCIVSDIPQALKISGRVSKTQVPESPLHVSESSSCVSGSGAEEEIASRDMKIVEDYWSDQINSLKNKPAFAEGKQMLPDEIDLYNFFETWRGRAYCVFGDFRFTPVGPRYDYNCRSLQFYLSLYSHCSQIKYYIGLNRYYSIKFKDRGVFLVSEKRYNELKAKKGK